MSIVDTLVEIVDIASVTGDENELCSMLERRFADRPTQRIGDSLVVGRPDDGAPFFALYGHLDTVPQQGEWHARIDGDRVIGLGTSDMKGGVAVMIDLLEDPDLVPTHDVVYVFYAAEEGPADRNELGPVLDACSWLVDAELAIILEPTDGNVEMGCNGAMNAEIVFVGSSAHSARPWLGENAVTKGGAWLAKLHAMEPELVDIGGLEYREVFSVTRAEGGIANNIIPPEFRINLNYRFPPIYDLDQAKDRLHEVSAEADEIVIKDAAPAGAAFPDHPEVLRFESVAGGVRQAKQAWTDVARITARGGVAINFGPGIVAQAHQVDEYVPIDNLHRAYDVMRRFLAGEGS